MNTILTHDVLRHVLFAGYVPSFMSPLVSLACRQWRTWQIAYDARRTCRHGAYSPRRERVALTPKHVQVWHDSVVHIAACGNLTLFNWICSARHDRLGEDTLFYILKVAARAGHLEFLRATFPNLTSECDSFEANTIMEMAARGGHEHLVRVCAHEWGATDFSEAMCYAARGGHEHLVRLCYSFHRDRSGDTVPVPYLDTAMSMAAYGGFLDLVRIFYDEWGCRDDVDKAMVHAAMRGHEHVLRLCMEEWHATNVNGAFYYAVQYGHQRIACICREEWGATNVDEALHTAVGNGDMEMMRLCKEQWGATDFDGAMRHVTTHPDAKAVQELLRCWQAQKG